MARYTKTENLQLLRAKTEKLNQKLAKSAKPKTPMPPSENHCLQILRNPVALNSYLGLSALSEKFFGLYKI